VLTVLKVLSAACELRVGVALGAISGLSREIDNRHQFPNPSFKLQTTIVRCPLVVEGWTFEGICVADCIFELSFLASHLNFFFSLFTASAHSFRRAALQALSIAAPF
jgi:hypothetical protein